jgi:hypothetical protein
MSEATVPTVTLPDGGRFPGLGLGTWHMGERARSRADEIVAVRLALQLGYRPGPVPTPDASANEGLGVQGKADAAARTGRPGKKDNAVVRVETFVPSGLPA